MVVPYQPCHTKTIRIKKELRMSTDVINRQQAEGSFQPKSFHIMVLVLRVVLGGLMLEAGLDKLINGGFSIAGYVSNGSGPFASWFANFATMSSTLDPLVIWGEILIGLSLIFGVFLRFGSFWGALLMVLYYLPYLPPENGWISKQIIYMLVFIMMMFSGSGYFFGIDKLAKKLAEKWPVFRFVLG
jgi:thiosulfate dehydrogenase [quinone] large subunit